MRPDGQGSTGQVGSPVKESSFLNRETSAEDAGEEGGTGIPIRR